MDAFCFFLAPPPLRGGPEGGSGLPFSFTGRGFGPDPGGISLIFGVEAAPPTANPVGKGGGLRPPTFSSGFCGRMGRLDLPNRRSPPGQPPRIRISSGALVMCRSVGTVPGILGLAWPRFRPESAALSLAPGLSRGTSDGVSSRKLVSPLNYRCLQTKSRRTL